MLCYVKKKTKKKVVGLFLRFRTKIGTPTIRRSGMLRSYKSNTQVLLDAKEQNKVEQNGTVYIT